jgi:hypothetical protein
MNINDDKRQQLLDELMAGGGESANGALLQPWRHLARQLSPLIGESGFCALFGRSGRLVAARYGWLMAGSSFKTIDVLIAALGDSFDGVAADEVRAGNIALLDTFTRLLADLIGEALTTRLLNAASQRQGDQKNAQEQKQ